MSENTETAVAQDPLQNLCSLPLDFTASSCLSEDYLLTTDIPVRTVPGSVAMWQNAEGRSEALVIDAQNRLSHVYRDQNSDSGWNSQPVAVGLAVGEVAVAKDADGTANAFLSAELGELHHLRQNPDGSWPDSPEDLKREAVRLSVEPYYLFDWSRHTLAQMGLLVCGVTPDFKQVWVGAYETNGVWTWNQFADSKIQELTSSAFGIQVSSMPSGQVANELVVVLSTVIDGKMCFKSFAPSNLKQQSYPKDWTPVAAMQGTTAPNTTLVDFARVWDAGSLGYLLAIDKNGSLWISYLTSVSGSDIVRAYFYRVPTVTVARVSGTQQPQNPTLVQLYVTDAKGSLWVVRQAQTDGSNVPTWNDPVPLGDDVYITVTPKDSNSRAEAFALGASSTELETTTLRLFSQDPATTDWTVLPVQQSASPDADPTHVSSYLTTVSVQDANGVPALGEQVGITSSGPVTVWVNGVAHDVGPDQPVSCQTDFTGKLNIMSPAMGLHTPSLTLTANDSSEGQTASITVNPYQQVHDYLAGSTSLNDLPSFGASTLQSARGGDGNPLVPGLTSDGAQNTANMIKQAMALRPTSSLTASATSPAARSRRPAPTASGEPAAGWKMDFSDPTTPTFTPVSSAEIAADRTQLQGQLLGSVADDLKRFMGDVWHAINHGAIRVDALVIDTVNRSVHLILEGFGDLGDIAIREGEKGIEDVVHVIHTIFAAIGAEIERVVEWLRALFNWDDILNTYRVIEYCMGQGIPRLQALVTDHAALFVDKFFAGLKDDVRKHLDDLKSNQGNQNLTQLARGASPTTNEEPQTTSAGVPDPSDFHSHPQHHWVFTKAQTNVQGTTGSMAAPATDSLNDPLEELKRAAQGAWTEFDHALNELKHFFIDTVKDPARFKQLAVNDLIQALEDAVLALLDLLDGVVRALLALVNLTLDEIESLLNKTLHIPLLSSLFKKITAEKAHQGQAFSAGGEDLTITRLVSLMLAVPITLVYKLSHDNEPLFTTDMVEQLTTSPAPTGTLSAVPSTVGDASTDAFKQRLSTGLAWAAAGEQAIWALVDTTVDQAAVINSGADSDEGPLPEDERVGPKDGTDAADFVDLLSISLQMAGQILWWPNDSGNPPPYDGFPADSDFHKWQLGMWSCYWAPMLVDSAFFVAARTTSRKVDPPGKIINSIIGLVTFAVSGSASVLGYEERKLNGWDVAGNILGPVSYAGQFLLIDDIVTDSGGATAVLQLCNDLFTGEGCAYAMTMSVDQE